ncbi:hypothetical protein DVH24_020488 [Malus domestica]|uniref:Uncharacterized protein n=1 Tax=Malus domestica TaxID=3750 RepID=A0A498J9G2_MALDO|nr:hypothetical protein DVH24_020488 [Malus domestica]
MTVVETQITESLPRTPGTKTAKVLDWDDSSLGSPTMKMGYVLNISNLLWIFCLNKFCSEDRKRLAIWLTSNNIDIVPNLVITICIILQVWGFITKCLGNS